MKGSCLCGAITFEVSASPQGVSVCHCSQCRKMSGYAWSSARVPVAALGIDGPVHWFEASPMARRGICQGCGAYLFWQGAEDDTVIFALGAIDGPTGLQVEKHIFTSDKGDYYDIADGIRQIP